MLRPMQQADEAEHRGDAVGALAIIEEHLLGSDGRTFWRQSRIERLLQVAELSPMLPAWATSRWILEQALQLMHPAVREPHRRARQVAVELRGGTDALSGVDEADAMVKVIDHDWVYRQLVLYEYGGLATFLRCAATPDLVVGADHIHDWARSPMRVLRYEERTEQTLTWTDLSSGDGVEVPNLGAAAMLLPGECALGRLVPTNAGLMFEGTTLRIPEALAADVARDPSGWLEALRAWPRDEVGDGPGDDTFETAILQGNFLLTDVPRPVSQFALALSLSAHRVGEPTLGDVAMALLDLARDLVSGDLVVAAEELDPWPCLAAELLGPTMFSRLADQVTVADSNLLDELARRLAGPAADVCRELAQLIDDVA